MKTPSLGALAFLLAACTSASTLPPKEAPPKDSATATPEPSASSASPAPSSSAAQKEGAITLLVDAKSVACEGEGPMTCLRIRASTADEWTLLYQPIEGFSFEEGHAYELLVERSEVARPPAGGSSIRYQLISIVEDRKAP